MGLDVSHGAFSGSYSAFNRFRQAICKAMGGSFPPHEEDFLSDGAGPEPASWYWGDDYSEKTHPGLFALISHSDCEGEISPSDCDAIARELEAVLPRLDVLGIGFGHIQRDGGYGAVARRFIAGCRKAVDQKRPLVFG